MAVIRKKEIIHMEKKELKNKLKELEMEMLKLKSQKGQATGGTIKLKEIKKTIARIHTKLNQGGKQNT